MIHTVETLKELHEQRFAAMDKAIILAAEEIARRLEVLNHYHELAREKERTFINREAFETFRERVADDLSQIRRESQTADGSATHIRETTLKAVADEIAEQNTKNEMRFGKIEAVYSKLIGGIALGTFIFPLLTGMIIYLLTRNQ
ncbi:MAG: hypothetical protein ACREDD_09040 [Methylocella sp.]